MVALIDGRSAIFRDMLGPDDTQVSAVLNADQAATIVKADDVGVDNLTNAETGLIDQAISRIKESIRP